MTGRALFEINPALDVSALARRFAADGRIQVRDILTDETARTIRDILLNQTRWGLAWRAGAEGPHGLRAEQVAAMPPAEGARISGAIDRAMKEVGYAFLYGQYPILDAYLGGWNPGSPHDLLLEYINAEPFLDLVRAVTGIPKLIKGDAQATLYAPGHFLALHDDGHVAEGWQVAYVLNFCLEPWRPEWGGYLLFHDEEGDVIQGYRPRFNSLNMFRVPQKHSVGYVPPYAPAGRVSITGWFRDR